MSCERNIWKVLALAVSLACAVSLVGCQRQAQPSGDLTQPDSSASQLVESASSLTESAASQPPSSSDSGETSQSSSQEAEGAGSSQTVDSSSSQQASSEAASQPSSSQEAASESQTPSIPFTLVEYFDAGGVFHSPDDPLHMSSQAQIITEPSGLEGCDIQNKERYDDAFFNESALLYLELPYGHIGSHERVNRLIPSGQQLIVDYTTFHPSIVADACTTNVILLEVSKSDLKGITQVVLQAHKIVWYADDPEPEGWNPWEYTNSQSGTASS